MNIGTKIMNNSNQSCDENDLKEVLANDYGIRRQVPGILQDHLGVKKPDELRNQELFYRAIGR
jgi:hypothetical protein